MRKFIAVCVAAWCVLMVVVISMLGLCLLGPICAVIWGGVAILYFAPDAYEVIEAAWR